MLLVPEGTRGGGRSGSPDSLPASMPRTPDGVSSAPNYLSMWASHLYRARRPRGLHSGRQAHLSGAGPSFVLDSQHPCSSQDEPVGWAGIRGVPAAWADSLLLSLLTLPCGVQELVKNEDLCLMPRNRSGFNELAKTRFLAYSLYHSLQDLDMRSTRYWLLEKKANPNYLLEEFGIAPIHIAAGVGDDTFGALAMRLCLSCGGDPNIPSIDGFTPVHIAAIWKRMGVLELLIRNGGDVCLRDQDGFTSLDYVQRENSLEMSNSFHSSVPIQECEALNPLALEVSSQGGEGLAEFVHSSNSLGSESYVTMSDESENGILNNGFLADDCDVFKCEFSDVETASFFETYLPLDDPPKPTGLCSALVTPYIPLKTPEDEIALTYPWSPDPHTNPGASVGISLARFKSEVEQQIGSRMSLISRLSTESGTYYEAPEILSDHSIGSLSSCATERLKYLLQERQIQHGPIVKSTKRVYLYQLKKTKNEPVNEPPKIQRLEFNDVVLATLNDRLFEYIGKWSALESEMVESLKNTKTEPKLDPSKQYFTYLLLDPLVSGLAEKRAHGNDVVNFWPQFLKSVFYIGKGKNSRPLDHLVDAIRSNKIPTSEKIKKIKSIWEKEVGVVTIHVFHNISEAEALTREACMILALSNARLTNVQSGRCYGSVQQWTLKSKRQLGTVLLYRAMNLMLAEGVRQLFPSDLKR